MNTLNALIAGLIMQAPSVYIHPPPTVYMRPPVMAYAAPPQRPQMNQEQWKQAIVAEAQRYCDRFPRDPLCHFKQIVSQP